jgi:hypothetical protein
VPKNLLVAVALAALVTGCSHGSAQSGSSATADANQANSAGDIPDTQAFVRYEGTGWSVLVPEGWARTQGGSAVTFAWNSDGEAIVSSPRADAATVIRERFGATGTGTPRVATVGGQSATVFTFVSRSKPDPVTGKTLTLENQVYLFARGGRRAMLVLWAPKGADNVDQWKKISESFRWK